MKRKAICSKCHHVIKIEVNSNQAECPDCHETIFVSDAIKAYDRAVMIYSKKGENYLVSGANYEKAFQNYSCLLKLKDDDLTTLFNTVIARLYCSSLKQCFIKEATDILLNGSDNITIDIDNVKQLSDYLKKIREKSKIVVEAMSIHKEDSGYTLNNYLTSLKEYKYYIESYIQIYQSLDALNQYFEDSLELLNDEIKECDIELNKEYKVKNESKEPHPIYNKKNKENYDIFENNKKLFNLRIALLILMGVGFILSLVGLFMLIAKFNNDAVKFTILGIGLTLFIGGYFIQHSIKSKIYHLNY